MTRSWFGALAIHRKLVVIALAVSSLALATATVGLMTFDLFRFRTSAATNTRIVGGMLAQNLGAALVFEDLSGAREILTTVRTQGQITRACLYTGDGSLFAHYEQSAMTPCPTQPIPLDDWRTVAVSVPVTREGVTVGTVYVERSLSDVSGRISVAAMASGGVLAIAGLVAFAAASRLQRMISGPIAELANAARAVEIAPGQGLPPIDVPPDETGELAAALREMVERLNQGRAELVHANEALHREIDERQRMQDEREALLARERAASRLKDEFLAAVSHELRTPLNVIMGWAQLLATAKPDDPAFIRGITSVLRNAQAQCRVIDDLLDVSRITAGKLQMHLHRLDLRSIVQGSLEAIAQAASVKDLLVESELPDVACLVRGDQHRLQQVLWNLLSNAVKFTPSGGKVRVRLLQAGRTCVLTVSDTGIGIEREFLQYVFDRFRQADGTTTREHQGLGLGLAIVRDLVELHGGTVRATSEGSGRGATFTVTLPIVADHQHPGRDDGAHDQGEPLLTGLSVLAVDDDLDTLDVLGSVLRTAGAGVRLASSGAEAVGFWREAPADVLLCDLAMPHMDGFAVLSSIRRLEAESARAHALALTAHASEEARVLCLEAGFEGWITKPYNAAQLIGSVAQAVGRLPVPQG